MREITHARGQPLSKRHRRHRFVKCEDKKIFNAPSGTNRRTFYFGPDDLKTKQETSDDDETSVSQRDKQQQNTGTALSFLPSFSSSVFKETNV